MYSKSLGPRGRGPKVLGVLGPRPLGPWDLRYLGLKVWGPKVRGPKAQGLMALESIIGQKSIENDIGQHYLFNYCPKLKKLDPSPPKPINMI